MYRMTDSQTPHVAGSDDPIGREIAKIEAIPERDRSRQDTRNLIRLRLVRAAQDRLFPLPKEEA
jgi:hypothetical protein